MNKASHRSFAPARSGSVRESLVAAAERSELRGEPLEHIYMERVFDEATYATLLAAMPGAAFIIS